MPDKYAPCCRYHRCSLSDRIGNGWSNNVCLRSNKVQKSASAPDGATQNSPEVRTAACAEVLFHRCRFAPIRGLVHQQPIERNRTERNAKREEKDGSIGPHRISSCHRGRYEGI